MKLYRFVFGYLLPSQFLKTPPEPTASFEGQTIIVTGSNTGVGYEAVKHLIRLKASKIIIAVRTIKKGQAAVEKLVADTKCDPARLEVWQFDLASTKSIDEFVAKANALERLDAVIQNAGVASVDGLIDGMEGTKVVNLLAPLYFANAIMPKLRESAQKTGKMGRFSFIGSDAMYILPVDEINKVKGSLLEAMDDPAQRKGPFALGFTRYSLTKAFLFYAVHTMAARIPITPTSNVLINVETPGMTLSDFGESRDQPWGSFLKTLKIVVMGWIARRTDVGARTYIHAIEPELSHAAHGHFLMDSRVIVQNPMLGFRDADEVEVRLAKELDAYFNKHK